MSKNSRLRCYVLTKNSQRRLNQVLESIRGLVNEIVILDSGSADATEEIAGRFEAKFYQRSFSSSISIRRAPSIPELATRVGSCTQ